jgi:3-(3-hydroxy-phenyl)propionate hydroxylase
VSARLAAYLAERAVAHAPERFKRFAERGLSLHEATARRRVLLVGEAAHLFSPFGARGMNSGFADAAAAADAIAAAMSSPLPEAARAAIERFAAVRHDAAEFNRAAARSALAHMEATDPRIRVKRRVAAALAPRFERAGRWLDEAPYGPRGGRRGRQGRY